MCRDELPGLVYTVVFLEFIIKCSRYLIPSFQILNLSMTLKKVYFFYTLTETQFVRRQVKVLDVKIYLSTLMG